MDISVLAQRPHILERNRVERFFVGGKLLDRWQGVTEEKDSTWSEESIVTTTEYIGPAKHLPGNGLSRTRTAEDTVVTLKELIHMDEKAFLGDRYAGQTFGQSGVLARVGDSLIRLVIQVHPDREGARKYLNFPSGKTEAWYILDTRVIDGVHPCVHVGFKKGVTPAIWRDVFDRQDIPAMLDCMHRIEVEKGDVILIESGTPHAMGSGCLFLEIHEPCDYTIRTEKTYFGREIPDGDLHYGMGFDAMFTLFHYDTYTEEEIRRKVLLPRVKIAQSEGGALSEIISYGAAKRFSANALELHGAYGIPDFDGHYIMITTVGQTKLWYPGGSVTVPQGRGVFVPALAKGMTAEGNGEIVIAYPYQA